MARYAVIEGDRVANIVEASAEVASARGLFPVPDHVEIGWTYDGSYHAPVIPEAEARAAIKPITRRQARLVLLQIGKLADVDTKLAELPLPQREAAVIEWQDALVFERDHPLISTLGAALGLTETQIDALFATAAGL